MQPHSQPSFFEREIIGIPIWIHLVAGLVSCGVWLVILPFVVVFGAVEEGIERAAGKVLTLPFRLLHRLARWIYARLPGRS